MFRWYVDYDLSAWPVSFNAESKATPEAVRESIARFYDAGEDPQKQESDTEKVSHYMTNLLKPFLQRHGDMITILTANSKANVVDINAMYGIHFPHDQIVSLFDLKAERFNADYGTSYSPNLFAAVVKFHKKVVEASKTSISNIAADFNVTETNIRLAHALHIQNMLVYDTNITKRAYIKDRGVPFIFVDDSFSVVQNVQTLADNGELQGFTVHVPRPGRHPAFETCGMFGEPALKMVGGDWSPYLKDLTAKLVPTFRTYTKQKRKFIIDTDIGDDVDDAFAVSCALKMHQAGDIEVICFITSGNGNHQARARLIYQLQMAVFGQLEVPIVCGMLGGDSNADYMALGDVGEEFPTLEDMAVSVRSRIDQCTSILCIGPLNNLLLLRPPTDTQIILMGGQFETGFDGQPMHMAEYNVSKDITSWKYILSHYKRVFVVPLDTAGMARIPEWNQFLTSKKPLALTLQQMYALWSDSNVKRRGDSHPIVRDIREGKSNIQFDSAALYLSLGTLYESARIKYAPIEVDDEGKTSFAATGPKAVTAIGWTGRGLAAFQEWFRALIV